MSQPTNAEILTAVKANGKRLDEIEKRLDKHEEFFAALALGQAQINKHIDDLKNDSIPT